MTELNSWEFLEAVLVGAMRRASHLLKKAGYDRYGWDPKIDPWGADIEGACAEKLVAKALDRYFVGTIGGPDSGADVGDIGVGSTTRENGCLIIHDGDRDDQVFVLVVGRAPNQRIAGWARAYDAKLPAYWREVKTEDGKSRGAYYMPQEKLTKVQGYRQNENRK